MTKAEPKPSEDRVVATFRSLAEQHAAERRRRGADAVWRQIEARQRGDQTPPAGKRPPQARLILSWPKLLAAALVCVGLSAAVVLGVHRLTLEPQPAFTYRVLGASMHGPVLQTAAEPATIAFSDGSHIQAEAHTTLSVDVLGPGRVSTRLAAGQLRVKVTRAETTDWRFLAGPYEVRVVGTVFDLSWEPSPERFTLAMHEGQVQVTLPGPLVRSIGAGQTLILPASEAPPSSPAARTTAATPADSVALDEGSPAAAQPRSRAAPLAAERRTPPLGAPSWPQLVATGHFTDVVELAEQSGVVRVLAERPAADLKALAQAARYTAREPLAVQSWTAIRRRFAGTPAASEAAFFLGRIRDERGEPARALQEFDNYLREAPRGTYASEALGRKLSLVRRLQGQPAARRWAHEYLQRFPTGSYAETARGILTAE